MLLDYLLSSSLGPGLSSGPFRPPFISPVLAGPSLWIGGCQPLVPPSPSSSMSAPCKVAEPPASPSQSPTQSPITLDVAIIPAVPNPGPAVTDTNTLHHQDLPGLPLSHAATTTTAPVSAVPGENTLHLSLSHATATTTATTTAPISATPGTNTLHRQDLSHAQAAPGPGPAQCARGGKKAKKPKKSSSEWRQRDDAYVATSSHANELIAALASVSEAWTSRSVEWLDAISSFQSNPESFIVDSLQSIANRCQDLERKEIRVNFLFMINCMQLVMKCQWYVLFATMIVHDRTK